MTSTSTSSPDAPKNAADNRNPPPQEQQWTSGPLGSVAVRGAVFIEVCLDALPQLHHQLGGTARRERSRWLFAAVLCLGKTQFRLLPWLRRCAAWNLLDVNDNPPAGRCPHRCASRLGRFMDARGPAESHGGAPPAASQITLVAGTPPARPPTPPRVLSRAWPPPAVSATLGRPDRRRPEPSRCCARPGSAAGPLGVSGGRGRIRPVSTSHTAYMYDLSAYFGFGVE